MREHDTAALYNGLILGLSLQGISDAIAHGYIEKQADATWASVTDLLRTIRCGCPKLKGFATCWDYSCRKALAMCAQPHFTFAIGTDGLRPL